MSIEVIILSIMFLFSIAFTLFVVYSLTSQMSKSMEVFNLIFKEHGNTRVAQAESLEKAMERQSEQSSELFRLMIRGLISLETERSKLLAEIDTKEMEIYGQKLESKYQKNNTTGKFTDTPKAKPIPADISRGSVEANGTTPDVFPIPPKPPKPQEDLRKELASND
jgi:hypothetical protein